MLYTFNSKSYKLNKSSPSSDGSSALWEESRSPTDEAMMQQVIKSISRVQLPMQTCSDVFPGRGGVECCQLGKRCTAWQQRGDRGQWAEGKEDFNLAEANKSKNRKHVLAQNN